MKKLLSVVTLVLLAIPAYAQDDFGGFGDSVLSSSDIDALFGGGNRGRNNQNNNNGNNIPDPEALFLQMKDLLKNQKAPLSKDQEKALKPMLVTEVQSMREYLEGQFGNRNNQNQNNQNNQNRGNSQANMIAELFKLIPKYNTDLLTAMKAELTPDQATLITKAEKDKKVCLTLVDLMNVQQGNRGNRGNENFNRGGGGGFPIGFEGFEAFGGFEPQGGGGGGRGGRGGNNNSWNQNIPDRPFCTNGSSTPAQRLEPFAQVLTKGKKPLTPEQEPKLTGLIETKMKVMEEELKASDQQMSNLLNEIARSRNNNQNNNNQNNQTVNPQTLRNNIVNTIMTQLGIPNNNNNNNNNRGNFQNNNQTQNNPQNAQNNNNQGGGRGNRGGNNNNNLQAEIQRKNEELLDKVAVSLNPPQTKIVKKYKYDQIKAKGGAERYRAIMEEEGTPLAPEQRTQIQALFNSQNQGVRQYADELVQKEVASIPPEQFAAAAQQNQQNQQNWQQGRGNQPNVNSVGANQMAQQIVAKVMPEVSRRRAVLEKVTQDTIMKLLTPPQVASYKLSTM